jgi:hypothetical protein
MLVPSKGMNAEMPDPYEDRVYVGTTGHQDEFWDGDIAELMIFNRILTESELRLVERSLANEYGIQIQELQQGNK